MSGKNNDEAVLVTGGAGFIGSRLVKALLREKPHRPVCVFDNFHPQVHAPHADPFAELSSPTNLTVVRGDVADKDALGACLTSVRPTLIYHLAAETGTGQSYDEPSRYCDVNISGTANLIEAIRASGAVSKVVLAASRAVYGEGAYADAQQRVYVGLARSAEAMSAGDYSVSLPADAVKPFRAVASSAEIAPAPASIYASSKLMQEYLFTQAGEGAPWDAIMLRFQNVYGPGQSLRNPYTGVLSFFANQILDGKTLDIYEDGEIARDFVFVDDVVAALLVAGSRSLAHGAIVDIGSGEAVSILDTAKTLMRTLGQPEDRFKITGRFRVGDIQFACADISMAKRLLGWQPSVPLAEGLNRLAKWVKVERDNGRAQ